MESGETPTQKQVIEGMAAMSELLGLLGESAAKLAPLVDFMEKAAAGDTLKWFKAVELASDCTEDDLAGMVIVAASVIGRIKAKTRGIDAYEAIKEIFTAKASEA